MGGFHIAMNFLGAIGHLMKETGLEDIMVEAGVCQPGTAKKLLDGKDYYAMVHAHFAVEQALFSLLWEAFEASALDQDANNFTTLSTCLAQVITSLNEGKRPIISEEDGSMIDNMRQQLEGFSRTLDSPTTKLWIMYLQMMEILHKFIAAERAGIWNLHIQATEEMLPYIVSAGHNKYTACLPHYLAAMKELPTPVKSEFEKGNFTVRQRLGKFNGVWSDMALEQTYNKDAKTKLLHGISQRPETITKYLRALPALTAISEKTLEMANLTQDSQRPEATTAERNLRLVQNIKAVIKEKITNPFILSGNLLMNISTGQTTQSLELVDAKKKGLDALERAEQANADKVTPVKLKTFVEKTKKKPTLDQTKELYKEERSVVRSLCFAENLSEEEKIDQFSHEWTQYPSSIFKPDALHPNGFSMRKGNKCDYLAMLKTEMSDEWREQKEMDESDEKTVYFIDLMAFIQRYQDMGSSTFLELSNKYLKKILRTQPKGCYTVHVVGDRYNFSKETSLKMEERLRRESMSVRGKTFLPQDNLKIPNWKSFISNRENKHHLQEYLCNTWLKNCEHIPAGFSLVLGGMESGPAKMLSHFGVMSTEQLSCEEHEEADTRIFAHLAYSVEEQGCRRAVISATDTDIVMLSIYHGPKIDGLIELWIQKFDTFIPCHWIAQFISSKYSTHTSSSLLFTYSLTGCDSVSYIFNCGKKRALTISLESDKTLEPLAEYGMPGVSTEVSEAIEESARKYICALYRRKDFPGSLDELRCHLFQSKNSDIRSIPPTSNAFSLHLMRALYQILIWKRATSNRLELPPPTDFGRQLKDGCLVATLMTKPPKPTSQPTKCHCGKDKCRSRCRCRKSGFQCTLACKCCRDPLKCTNIHESEPEYIDD